MADTNKTTQPLFDAYLFADYSGAAAPAAQRKAIVAFSAEGRCPPERVPGQFTRAELVSKTVEYLRNWSKRRMRAALGFDHQFSVPLALLRELELDKLSYREFLPRLINGTYGSDAPAFDHPKRFAAAFNQWLVAHGRPKYFYSATKPSYCIPSTNPRSGDGGLYRLTEVSPSVNGGGSPKAFNRVGDNGSVGGQTLVGLEGLWSLISTCAEESIPLKVWPMDGLDIGSEVYKSCHVLIEPYPAAVRPEALPYTDENDASSSALAVQEADQAGSLPSLLDLSGLSTVNKGKAAVEGWIFGHRPQQ